MIHLSIFHPELRLFWRLELITGTTEITKIFVIISVFAVILLYSEI